MTASNRKTTAQIQAAFLERQVTALPGWRNILNQLTWKLQDLTQRFKQEPTAELLAEISQQIQQLANMKELPSLILDEKLTLQETLEHWSTTVNKLESQFLTAQQHTLEKALETLAKKLPQQRKLEEQKFSLREMRLKIQELRNILMIRQQRWNSAPTQAHQLEFKNFQQVKDHYNVWVTQFNELSKKTLLPPLEEREQSRPKRSPG